MTTLEISPSFEEDALFRLLGGGKSCSFSRAVSLKIERLRGILNDLVKPQLYYRKVSINSIYNGSVNLQGGTVFKSLKLSKTVKDCEFIVCFIATVGRAIEREIKRLTHENRLSTAYILDSLGSLAVESIVEKFHKGMKNKYKAQGKVATLRFSPGYCDWFVTEQKKLFSLFDSFQLGVKLLDSCLMYPRKSISGVFGVLPFSGETSRMRYNPCSECNKLDCVARRG